ncbi:Papain-like cysteine protease AvrRpt2 [Histomonas meleagridis]|uniref:Papain-like cysteine protease AvrRpt2 n=1 Tax=Histomonas meleagridis TaxID=135588 RepID=UPI003559A521|nr:Papain-like cysteine protease AvrRpt2 [Histomonas meleagridis]KAH0799306.1 Papain-like cysteine protease AvrRpt2 [Histomonas meleagridis]
MGDCGKIVSLILNVLLLVVDIVLIVCYFVVSKDEITHVVPPVSHDQVIPITGKYYMDKIEGPAAAQFQYDHLDSKYYTMHDFYNMKSEGSLKILSNYRTYQQTSELSCGCCCIIMAADYTEKDTSISERRCSDIAGTNESGTTPENLMHVLDTMNYDYEANVGGPNGNPFNDYKSFRTWVQKSIDDGYPIIVCCNDLGGHYITIIGIDTLGTDETYDDVLIFADPYDNTDHRQDGYNVWELERFYDLWAVPLDLLTDREHASFRYIQVKGKKAQ